MRATGTEADGFCSKILLESFHPVLAAEPTRLVAAVGRIGAIPPAAVDRHGASPYPTGESDGPVLGGGEHASAETVLAVVGNTESFLVVVERDDDEYGPEDLFLSDRHRVVDIGKQGWFDEESGGKAGRTAAAGDQPRLLLRSPC